MGHRYAASLLLSRFRAELDFLLQQALQIGERGLPAADWQPVVDIVETAESIVILAEVPGLTTADLKVEVRGTWVLLSGIKPTAATAEITGKPVKFQCVERGRGKFLREIQLFWPVNSHRGTARLADGLLTLEFPKVQEKRQAARELIIEEQGGGLP
jgi:HSP20 family protein